MIFKNKKGLESYVTYMIYGFIVLVILFLGVRILTASWGSTATEATCETSVLLRSSAVAKGTIISPELVPLKCATQYKCITMGGICPKGYEKIPVISDQEIKQKLADEMYSCWRMLGQGKIQFISPSTVSQRTCLPCSVITFDDKLKGKQILGFQNYLATAEVSNGTTYLQYLSNAKVIQTLGQEPVIDTNKDYAVVYSLNSGQYLSEIANGAVGLAATGAAAAIGCKLGAGAGVLIFGVPTLGAGSAPGAAIGCGVGGVIGATGGLYASFKSSSFFTYIASVAGFQQEIYPAISLDEYTAENLASCEKFEGI